MFNDEIHSYDQVVRTLKRVLNVDDKRAFEFATVVDKEGRSSIRHGKKAQCDHVKSQVEVCFSRKFSRFVINFVVN